MSSWGTPALVLVFALAGVATWVAGAFLSKATDGLMLLLGLQRFKIEADAAIPPGTHQVRMEFAYDGGGPAKGGTVTLYLDGDKTGEGRVDATVPLIFSADETADVGRDTASPVSDDYEGESSVFTGTVNWVQIDLGEDAEDADHMITPEERLRVAMARQ